jgi:hypothetical protein
LSTTLWSSSLPSFAETGCGRRVEILGTSKPARGFGHGVNQGFQHFLATGSENALVVPNPGKKRPFSGGPGRRCVTMPDPVMATALRNRRSSSCGAPLSSTCAAN